jgi:uncharacterized oxidoreductase
MKLTDNDIVLTGGTSGIGKELVRLLHRKNRMIVIARSRDALDQLVSEFSNVTACCADLSRPDDVESAAGRILEQSPTIDLLINNAAVQYTPRLLETGFSYASISHEIAVNLTAVCGLTALLLPALVQEKATAVVNINSGLGLVPKAESAVYCATKGGLNIFSQSLRNQVEQTHVRVFQAFLPLVDTPMTRGRGRKKLTARLAAERIVYGLEHDIEDHDIGKVKLLRLVIRLSPKLARHIMKRV